MFSQPKPRFESAHSSQQISPDQLLSHGKQFIKRALERQYSGVVNAHDIDDVSQTAWFKAFRFKDSFDPSRSKFSSWLTLIANSAAKDFLKQRSSQQRRGSAAGKKDVSDMAAYVGEEGDQAAWETSRDLEKSLDCLTPNQKEVYVLKRFEGMTAKEIALKLRLPITTVISRINKATERMKQQDDEAA